MLPSSVNLSGEARAPGKGFLVITVASTSKSRFRRTGTYRPRSSSGKCVSYVSGVNQENRITIPGEGRHHQRLRRNEAETCHLYSCVRAKLCPFPKQRRNVLPHCGIICGPSSRIVSLSCSFEWAACSSLPGRGASYCCAVFPQSCVDGDDRRPRGVEVVAATYFFKSA